MLLSNQHHYRVQVEFNYRECGSIKNNRDTVKECLLLALTITMRHSL